MLLSPGPRFPPALQALSRGPSAVGFALAVGGGGTVRARRRRLKPED